jgi:putative ABC transport system permease protein
VRFAERLGVGLGDVLHFDVQGVPIAGRVVSLRQVRWNSFQPNFFVSFQPGVLEDAPKIFLASVPGLTNDAREALQSSIVERFPNVSVIDVTATVKRLLGLTKQLDWALFSTAWLALAVGLILVYAIARDEARSRRWETNLLKVLGAEFRQIRSSVDLEFGALGLFASLAGVAASLAASAIFAHSALDLEWRISLWPLVLVLLLVPTICIATSRLATRAVLRERPLALLQAAEA